MNLPVSQICALIVFASTWMLLVVNSTPMVDFDSKLNSFLVKRETRLDFPTPESPIRTTGRIQRDTSVKRKVKLATVRYSFCVSMTRVQGWCSLAMLLLFLKKKRWWWHGPARRALIEANWAVPPFFPVLVLFHFSLEVSTRSDESADVHPFKGEKPFRWWWQEPCMFVASTLCCRSSRVATQPLIIFEPPSFFLVAREGGVDWQEGCVKVSPQWLCMSGVDRM